MRKPVFGVSDQVRLKHACAVTEASYRLEISDIETRGIILSWQRTTNMPITARMRRLICTSVVRICKNRFSHDASQISND